MPEGEKKSYVQQPAAQVLRNAMATGHILFGGPTVTKAAVTPSNDVTEDKHGPLRCYSAITDILRICLHHHALEIPFLQMGRRGTVLRN